MKAIILNEFGPAANLQLADLPIPHIGHEQVLVKVDSLSINPVDIKTRQGKGTANNIKDRPIILGWDISGEVTESKSPLFNKGDQVFGMINFPGHGKAYAEYVVAPADQLYLIPENVTAEQAAASTLAALTAWQNLTEHYTVTQGQRVLIHAGSGGVGHFAIQIAKYLGAYVIATSSAKNKAFILSLGADEHIDYNTVQFNSVLKEIDFVLNVLSPDITERSLAVLKPGGTVISIASGVSEDIKAKALAKQVTALHTMVKPSGRNMEQIAELLGNEKLQPHIDQVFLFEDMQKAHEQMEGGRTIGKIIVKLP